MPVRRHLVHITGVQNDRPVAFLNRCGNEISREELAVAIFNRRSLGTSPTLFDPQTDLLIGINVYDPLVLEIKTFSKEDLEEEDEDL